ncbi:MAG: hypothetical protein LQ345_000985 [Seirophora villosa]|nr:MAG: hypothetical protein LQ345_000985 [Seirophora villosa]
MAADGPPRPSPSSKPLPIAQPSASIVLISPANEILLLRRVKRSTSFASAHVFPGGHIDAADGPLPPLRGDVRLHEDSATYRVGAIRECFEESGILLARKRRRRRRSRVEEEEEEPSTLLQLNDQERDSGRRAVHDKKIGFQDWVRAHGGELDTEGLQPFTRWLTPAHIPKRFSTQMYLYFLPLAHGGIPQTLHVPTSDGGVEHTEADFLPAREWLARARADEIILFPPQFFLLSLVADFLGPSAADGAEGLSTEALQAQREALLRFVATGDPPWGEKCITLLPLKRDGEALIMGLDEPGPELEGTDRRGDGERVIWGHFTGKDGSTGLRLGWRKDVMPARPNTTRSNEPFGTGTTDMGDTRHDLERVLRGPKEKL